MTLELFKCVPLGVKLTRSSCGDRHVRAGRELRHEGKQGVPHIVGAQRCATCPIGAAHTRGEKPDAWEDGAPLVLLEPPSLPEPGRSKWTGSASFPSSPPAPIARSTILPPKPITEGSKTMPRPAKKHTYNGKSLTAYAWADEPEAQTIGIGRQALFERLRSGWTIEEALTVPPGQRRASKRDVGAELETMVRPQKQKPPRAKATAAPTKKREPDAPDLAAPSLRVVWFAAGVEITSSTDPQTWAETFKRAHAGAA